MKKILIFLVSIIAIYPCMIKADCTDQEIVRMNKLASNVKVTPVFDENSESYNLIISNLSPLLYFVDLNKQITHYFSGNEIILYNYTPNQSYRFKFYSNNNNCYGRNIISKYINIPGYNKWYKEEICRGLEEQKFCQKWTNYIYTEDEINKLVNDYKNNLNKSENEKKVKKVYGFYDKLINFYKKYYYIILTSIIIILIYIIIWKKKKDSELF